jgi:hypothetical protein
MTDADDIQLSIHEESWRIIERILDQRRRKVMLTATVNADGQVTLQLPPEIASGKYTITLLIDDKKQD